MAAGKRKPIKHQVHLQNLLAYLVDQRHPNHVEYELSKFKTYSKINAATFNKEADEAFAWINRPGKKGRKLETLGHYFIFRFVDGTDLTEAERGFYESEMVRLGVSSGLVVSNHHHNLETLSTDFNFVQAGWTGDPPRALRTNQDDLLPPMQRVSNSLLKEMNEKRKTANQPLIIGVLDLMRARARKRRQTTIEDDIIAANKVQEVGPANLTEVLKQYGHQASPWTLESKTISIIPRGQKKAIRIDAEDLLDAAPSTDLAIIDEQIKQLSFETRRDKIVDEMLEISAKERAPRPKGHSR
jgi:hypothetical protein